MTILGEYRYLMISYSQCVKYEACRSCGANPVSIYVAFICSEYCNGHTLTRSRSFVRSPGEAALRLFEYECLFFGVSDRFCRVFNWYKIASSAIRFPSVPPKVRISLMMLQIEYQMLYWLTQLFTFSTGSVVRSKIIGKTFWTLGTGIPTFL